jgi:D-amino peptidase
MRVYISADMEGATGVTGPDDVIAGRPGYERFRKLLTGDVNAAVEGAVEAGATEVLVNESHGQARNILIEELNSKAEMITGYNKPLGMMEGINDSFAAAMLVAYHAMAGTTAAVMDHTYRGKEVINLRLNGKLAGEVALSSAVAGAFDVPVVMVTGDDKVAAEAKVLLGNVETAIVKEGLDRFVAKCAAPDITRRRIRDAAKKAVGRLREFKPYKVDLPVSVEVEFSTTAIAAAAALMPGIDRVSSRSISFRAKDFLEAYRTFRAAILLGCTTADSVYG